MIGACGTCDQLRRALERVEAENKALRKIGDAVSAMGPVFGGRRLGDEPLLAMVPIEKFGPVMDAWSEWKALSPPPQPEPSAKERVRCEVRDRSGEQCGLDKGHRGRHYLLIESDAPWFPTLPCTNPRRGSEGK